MEKIEWKNIDDIDELLTFLKQKGINHDEYHHYTNIDSLIKMIDSGYLLLTRGNSVNMNDQHECQVKGSIDLWDKIYLASFAFGKSENMAMWGLYGLPWDEAVRITIPKKAMKNWIEGIEEIYSAEFVNGKLRTNKLDVSFNKSLSDIVYVEGKRLGIEKKIYWTEKSLSLKNKELLWNVDNDPKMTGFIKNQAWKYENEVRIHIQLNKKIFKEKIAIKLTDDLISSMKITTGPYFRGNIIKKINDKIPSVLNQNQCSYSSFDRLVNYRSLCTMCRHENFIRK